MSAGRIHKPTAPSKIYHAILAFTTEKASDIFTLRPTLLLGNRTANDTNGPNGLQWNVLHDELNRSSIQQTADDIFLYLASLTVMVQLHGSCSPLEAPRRFHKFATYSYIVPVFNITHAQ
jgi:hypothetical protein